MTPDVRHFRKPGADKPQLNPKILSLKPQSGNPNPALSPEFEQQIHSLSLSLTHTNTHTYTNTYTHTYTYLKDNSHLCTHTHAQRHV